MPRLVTEWSSDDPDLAQTLRFMAALPDRSPERLAAEAALHTFQATELQRELGQILAERRVRQRQ